MGATYWLFVVLIVGFLAMDSRLGRLANLLEEMRHEISAIRSELTKDKERIRDLGYPGYYDPPARAISPEPPPPRADAFIRGMRSSGYYVGRLLRRARTGQT
jgi:hypothetical protein